MSLRPGVVIKLLRDVGNSYPFFKGDTFEIVEVLSTPPKRINAYLLKVREINNFLKDLNIFDYDECLPFDLLCHVDDFCIEIADTMELEYGRKHGKLR